METPFQLSGQEILEMAKEDQMMRSGPQWNETMDMEHTEKMKQIVAVIGWPTITKVGSDAAHAAWLLVQHADHDIEFQEYCLSLMKQEPMGEVSLTDIAYLEDRIRVSRGLPQLYGTQFCVDAHGTFGPSPIEDVSGIEQRREEVGLGSFMEYQKEMESIFHARNKSAGPAAN